MIEHGGSPPKKTAAGRDKGKVARSGLPIGNDLFGDRGDDVLFTLPKFPSPRFEAEPSPIIHNSLYMDTAGPIEVAPLKVLMAGQFLADQKRIMWLSQAAALQEFAYHANMVRQLGYNFYRRSELALADRE